jgi:hypothetical protein
MVHVAKISSALCLIQKMSDDASAWFEFSHFSGTTARDEVVGTLRHEREPSLLWVRSGIVHVRNQDVALIAMVKKMSFVTPASAWGLCSRNTGEIIAREFATRPYLLGKP